MPSFYQDRLGTNIGKTQKESVFVGGPGVDQVKQKQKHTFWPAGRAVFFRWKVHHLKRLVFANTISGQNAQVY